MNCLEALESPPNLTNLSKIREFQSFQTTTENLMRRKIDKIRWKKMSIIRRGHRTFDMCLESRNYSNIAEMVVHICIGRRQIFVQTMEFQCQLHTSETFISLYRPYASQFNQFYPKKHARSINNYHQSIFRPI